MIRELSKPIIGWAEAIVKNCLLRRGVIPAPLEVVEILLELYGRTFFTYPDLRWPDVTIINEYGLQESISVKLLVYFDSEQYHGQMRDRIRDAEIRNALALKGYIILVFWTPQVLNDPEKIAIEIEKAYLSFVKPNLVPPHQDSDFPNDLED